MWLIVLSDQLKITGMVSRYLTIYLILRKLISSELTRQGISLPLDRQSYSRRLLGLNFDAYTSPHYLTAPGSANILGVNQDVTPSPEYVFVALEQ
eukprot:gene17622-17825_t